MNDDVCSAGRLPRLEQGELALYFTCSLPTDNTSIWVWVRVSKLHCRQMSTLTFQTMLNSLIVKNVDTPSLQEFYLGCFI